MTSGDVRAALVPVKNARNIRKGHLVRGMRDINHVGWKPWEQGATDMQRLVEENRFERANQFYSAIEHSRTAEGLAHRSEQETQVANEELQASNEELQSTNEELQATTEELHASHASNEELQAATEKMERTAAELGRSNAELEQFAYVASHDLQEPLRMMSSYTQLLAQRYKGKLDADADEFMHYMTDGASRMQALINGLLAYSRVTKEAEDFQPTDCQAVLDQAVSNLQAAIEESGTMVTHDPLPTVRGDAMQLTQVFQNLIGNAIKFRSDKQPEVHVGVEGRGDEWLFSVQDNGIGIEPQYHDRIFGIFQRLHGREEHPGTGIGLTICKKIVERHGGRMWVESELGKGSMFYFTIPTSTSNQP